MRSLTVHAETAYTAQAIAAALSGFDAASIEANGDYEVKVMLGGGGREIVDVLNALELYVTNRANGPAQIEFEGRDYTLNPDPSRSPSPRSWKTWPNGAIALRPRVRKLVRAGPRQAS